MLKRRERVVVGVVVIVVVFVNYENVNLFFLFCFFYPVALQNVPLTLYALLFDKGSDVTSDSHGSGRNPGLPDQSAAP